MRLGMAVLVMAGAAGLAGCTAGPYGGVAESGGYVSPGYAGGYGYGYETGASPVYVAPPPAYGYGGTAYVGAPVYVDRGYSHGYRWRDGDDGYWRRQGWQGWQHGTPDPQQAQRYQQEQLYRQQVQQNRATYQQQVQQNQATYARQVQENTAKYQQQVQQNQAIVQQNQARYNQQVQENRAIYQRQLMEAQQKKLLGQ